MKKNKNLQKMMFSHDISATKIDSKFSKGFAIIKTFSNFETFYVYLLIVEFIMIEHTNTYFN